MPGVVVKMFVVPGVVVMEMMLDLVVDVGSLVVVMVGLVMVVLTVKGGGESGVCTGDGSCGDRGLSEISCGGGNCGLAGGIGVSGAGEKCSFRRNGFGCCDLVGLDFRLMLGD